MTEEYQKSIQMVRDWVENSQFFKAKNYLNSMLDQYPEYKLQIFFEYAETCFFEGEYAEYLEITKELVNATKDPEILDLAERRFAESVEKHSCIGKNNLKLLNGYSLFYGEDIPYFSYKILYMSANKVYVRENNQLIAIEIEEYTRPEDNSKYILGNVLSYSTLSAFKEKNMFTLSSGIPVSEQLFFYYDEAIFQVFIHLFDLTELLDKENVVIIAGESNLTNLFLEGCWYYPQVAFGKCKSGFEIILNKISEEVEALKSELLMQIEDYYDDIEKIKKNIKSKKFKVMLFSSRYTTAVQYHTRDVCRALNNLGIESEMILEPKNMTETLDLYIYRKILEFKPDVLLQMNFKKEEFCSMRGMKNIQNIVYVNYLQDPVGDDSLWSYFADVGDNEFITTIYTRHKPFLEAGFPKEKVIDCHIVANEEIYKKVTKKDPKYETDVCIMTHFVPYQAELREEEVVEGIIFDEMYRRGIEEGSFIFSKKAMSDFLEDLYFNDFLPIDKETVSIEDLKTHMFTFRYYSRVRNLLFSEILARWVIDSGHENLKLWGNGWDAREEFKKYAMGTAQNGPVLNSILGSSKITLGSNTFLTTTARVWETILSGGFYLSNELEIDEDVAPLSEFLIEGVEFDTFNSKQELAAKLKFYLENESARQEMSEKAEKKAKEVGTYTGFANHLIEELAERV